MADQVSQQPKAIELLVQNYQLLAEHYKIDDILHCKIDLDMAVRKAELSTLERLVLLQASYGYNFLEGAAQLNISPWRFQKIFKRACRKVAYVLGGEYLRGYR